MRRQVVLATALLCLCPSFALAGCPRTGWETTRRIVPSVLFWPAAPFILTAKQGRAALPAAGSPVRVSVRDASGTRFLSGAFVDTSAVGVRLRLAGGDTLTVERARMRCLEVPARNAASGAASGYTIGTLAGAVASAVTFADADAGGDGRVFAALFGAASGGATGALIGAAVGARGWRVVLEGR